MNTFYNQAVWVQWVIAIFLAVIGFYPALEIIRIAYDQPLFYLFFLLFVPIAQFATTPLFKLLGVYTYYSPMLLGYMANKKLIDLHSGSSFDYLWVMRKFKAGVDTRNRLLLYYLEGLIHIIEQIENGRIPNTVVITGTSYFFKEKTLHRLGFEFKNPSLSYRINLLANFIDLTWMYSVSQGKLQFPKLWKVKKASTTGGILFEHKEMIIDLYRKLSIRTIL